jgi:hypothetical protein
VPVNCDRGVPCQSTAIAALRRETDGHTSKQNRRSTSAGGGRGVMSSREYRSGSQSLWRQVSQATQSR